MLQLKRQIERVSDLKQEAIIERITGILIEKKYDINIVNKRLVEFDEAPGFNSKTAPTQLENGTFEIVQIDSNTTIKLTYTISFFPQIAMLLMLMVLGICCVIYMISFFLKTVLFGIIAIIAMSLLHFFSIEYRAKELMSRL